MKKNEEMVMSRFKSSLFIYVTLGKLLNSLKLLFHYLQNKKIIGIFIRYFE